MDLNRKRFVVLLVVLALAGCAAPRRVQAQFLGYVSSQSVAQTAFTNQAANGSSSTFSNIGQSAHFLSYCNTSFQGTVALVASTDGTFSAPNILASATYGQASSTDSTCHVLQAGGYYPAVRAQVLNYVAGSTTAFYTAIAAPVAFAASALGSNGPTSPIACDKFATATAAQNSAGTQLVPSLTGTQVYICQVMISFSAATTAGNLSIFPATAGGCGTPIVGTMWILQVTANTPQLVSFGGPLGAVMRTNGASTSLPVNPTVCISTGPLTASAMVSVSYAQF